MPQRSFSKGAGGKNAGSFSDDHSSAFPRAIMKIPTITDARLLYMDEPGAAWEQKSKNPVCTFGD